MLIVAGRRLDPLRSSGSSITARHFHSAARFGDRDLNRVEIGREHQFRTRGYL